MSTYARSDRSPHPKLSAHTSFLAATRTHYEFCMDNLLFKEASFLADTECAETFSPTMPCHPDADIIYNFALSLFYQRDHKRGIAMLHGCKTPKARYLLARHAFEIQDWRKAEAALVYLENKTSQSRKHEALYQGVINQILKESPNSCFNAQDVIINGGAGAYLLGQVKEKLGKVSEAVRCYMICLDLQPLMYPAFERLSELMTSDCESQNKKNLKVLNKHYPIPLEMPDPCPFKRFAARFFNRSRITAYVPYLHRNYGSMIRSVPATPVSFQLYTGTCILSETLRVANIPSVLHGPIINNPEVCFWTQQPITPLSFLDDWFSQYYHLAIATQLAHSHSPYKMVVNALDSLSDQLQDSSYALNLLANSYSDSGRHEDAVAIHELHMKLYPFSVTGLDRHSTALWSLKAGQKLNLLTQMVFRVSQHKPEVWCVVGNFFSLNKEHNLAIKYFRRSIELDPCYHYALGLCAYEYQANEKYEEAMKVYEYAIAINPQYTNAWWGMGNIYFKREEWMNAYYHYSRALSISKHNNGIKCSVAYAAEKWASMIRNEQHEAELRGQALDLYEEVAETEGKMQPMGLFRAALIYYRAQIFDQSLEYFEVLVNLKPEEAFVHYHMGHVYVSTRRRKLALKSYNRALCLTKDSHDREIIHRHLDKLQAELAKVPANLKNVMQPNSTNMEVSR